MKHMEDDFPMMMEAETGLQRGDPVAVAFGMYPVKDDAKSATAGHDVYVDVEHVRIAIPGQRNSLYFQPAQDSHRKRFPQAYAAFQNRSKGAPRVGMPIDLWPPITRSLAMTMKAANIDTVEALAEVHDSHVDRVGGREWRDKARLWVKQAKDGAVAIQAAADKKALEDRILALEAMLKAQPEMEADKAKSASQISPAVIDAVHTDDVARDVAAAARRPRAR